MSVLAKYKPLKDRKGEPKARFKKGEDVYLDFGKGDITGPHKINMVHFNGLSRVFMYGFEGKEMACGECYLKKNRNGKAQKFGSVIHDDAGTHQGLIQEGFNSSTGRLTSEGMRTPSGSLGVLFFRPDNEFIDWIAEYANGRMIIEVGCGTGWLLEQLSLRKVRVCGIDPFFSHDDYVAMNERRIKDNRDMIHIMTRKVEDVPQMIQKIGHKTLVLMARPCHSDYVENTLDIMIKGQEALYITVPENMSRYDDLGAYKNKAKLIKHKGWSADKEEVRSIIK